jgi:hypothetical protein
VKTLLILFLVSTLSFAAKVQLAWHPNPVEDRVLKYTIHYKQGDGNLDPVSTSSKFSAVSRTQEQSVDELATTMIIDSLEKGKTYYFAIRASNAEGDGPYSTTISFRIPTDDELPFSARKLDRSSWLISVDSEDTKFIKQHAIDGKPGTFYHNAWGANSTTTLPMSLVVQFPTAAKAQAISFLPRQDNYTDGDINEYLLQGSNNGKDWFDIASGSFAKTKLEKVVGFTEVTVSYIKLTAISDHGASPGGNIAIAEFNVMGTYEGSDLNNQPAPFQLKLVPD